MYQLATATHRLTITPDGERASKLSMASPRPRQRGHPGTITAIHLIDDSDPNPPTVVDLLDGIDGAYERAELGRRQAEAAHTIALDDL